LQPILAKFHNMKRSHIIILIGIAVVIAGLLAYSADFSTYDSINSAKEKPGKFVHIIAQLDKTQPVEFDPLKTPIIYLFMLLTAWAEKQKWFFTTANPPIWKKVKGWC
jgi:hypothetical protein